MRRVRGLGGKIRRAVLEMVQFGEPIGYSYEDHQQAVCCICKCQIQQKGLCQEYIFGGGECTPVCMHERLCLCSEKRKVGKEGKLGKSNFSEIKTRKRYLKDQTVVLSDRSHTERLKNMSALISAERQEGEVDGCALRSKE